MPVRVRAVPNDFKLLSRLPGAWIIRVVLERRFRRAPAPVDLDAEHRAVALPVVTALHTAIPAAAIGGVAGVIAEVAVVVVAMRGGVAAADIGADVEAAELRAGRPDHRGGPLVGHR